MTNTPLLLVDGHNLLWRAAFGFPAQIRSRDKSRDLTAVFGFFALLRVAIRDEFPDRPEVLVVFDGEHGSDGRKQDDADYKANRPADDEALTPILALPHVKQGLDLHGIAWVEVEDAEADDIIATLVHLDPQRPTRIFSTDRDYYQLLTDRVHVLNTCMRPGQRHIGPAQVSERYGIAPAQWASLRALSGDRSDNIPGVTGIEDKTAARLLANGAQVQDLPASGQLTGRAGERVRAQWEQVLTWHRMITMDTSVPLPAKPTGNPSTPLPAPAAVVEELGLW
ncbi:5'-3' exonuclease [Nocardiopsis tropica]|uniref:5'-3' exonuclease n=1 Tax=Nocardiopsis tropica TaxID=109330 RepID=A0ABU7KP84_9ACTN|nr:5'-3' exonuclease H3TH domain-containing protein [Nocardiopsis umidischolae]MEE2051101.1 5'-3' exonuclease H3TH domain-containing protein [Nocardiopsis umidischolae]